MSVVTRAIRLYQGTVSRLLPPVCRYHPSCSQYALETFENRGFWRGARYVARRLLRCHPFGRGGFDPPPPPLPSPFPSPKGKRGERGGPRRPRERSVSRFEMPTIGEGGKGRGKEKGKG